MQPYQQEDYFELRIWGSTPLQKGQPKSERACQCYSGLHVISGANNSWGSAHHWPRLGHSQLIARSQVDPYRRGQGRVVFRPTPRSALGEHLDVMRALLPVLLQFVAGFATRRQRRVAKVLSRRLSAQLTIWSPPTRPKMKNQFSWFAQSLSQSCFLIRSRHRKRMQQGGLVLLQSGESRSPGGFHAAMWRERRVSCLHLTQPCHRFP